MQRMAHPDLANTPMPPAATAGVADPALAVWLDRCAALSPEYGAGMSTHLPMALQALHGLGAPPARLAALYEQVAPTLSSRPPLRAAAAGPSGGWQADLGRFDAFESLNADFSAALAQQGLQALLFERLPVLMPAVGSAAFHGLIRTAHGVAAGHGAEVVCGLAYWASRFQPLAQVATATSATEFSQTNHCDLPAWLAALRGLPAPAGPAPRAISAGMRAWAAVPGFAAAAGTLRLQADTLAVLARLAAGLYAKTGNFTVLHGVTACHALHTLQPWLGNAAAVMPHFSQAFAAALLASGWAGCPGLPARPPLGASLPWPSITARAMASPDEHVIKLVHASLALWRVSGEAVFQAAAQRAVTP